MPGDENIIHRGPGWMGAVATGAAFALAWLMGAGLFAAATAAIATSTVYALVRASRPGRSTE